jgi:hypothetical protein
MALDPEQYRLSEADHEAIFQTYIKPQVFAFARPVERPTAIIFGGQPGAGKSRSVDAAVEDLEEKGGAVQIIGDELRGYHPAYATLLGRNDKTAAFYTDRDTGKWVEKCIAHAKSERFNVVIEGTMRNDEVVARTMRDFRDAGYTIDARALAVNFLLSEQGIFQRYENQKLDRGTGRMTTEQAHRAAYDGMPVSIERIERDGLADTLTLYRRGGEQIYRNELVQGAWKNPPRAREALEAERVRPMTLQERRDYAAAYEQLAELQARPERQPSDAERSILAMHRERAKNMVRAETFRQSAAKDVLAVFPDLAGAYEAQAAIDARLSARSMSAGKRAELSERGRQYIASRIERGRTPDVSRARSNPPRDADLDR